MIGVRRAFRGTGLGKLLLEAVIAMAESDPSSTGVDLTTELAGNLAFYQRFGFRVIADAHATPELHTWTLFRALG
jgi:GNAT superfamily N-acetyltransferase